MLVGFLYAEFIVTGFCIKSHLARAICLCLIRKLFNFSYYYITSEKKVMANLGFWSCFRQSKKAVLGLANFFARFFPTVQKKLFIHSEIFWLYVIFSRLSKTYQLYSGFYSYLDSGFFLHFPHMKYTHFLLVKIIHVVFPLSFPNFFW